MIESEQTIIRRADLILRSFYTWQAVSTFFLFAKVGNVLKFPDEYLRFVSDCPYIDILEFLIRPTVSISCFLTCILTAIYLAYRADSIVLRILHFLSFTAVVWWWWGFGVQCHDADKFLPLIVAFTLCFAPQYSGLVNKAAVADDLTRTLCVTRFNIGLI